MKNSFRSIHGSFSLSSFFNWLLVARLGLVFGRSGRGKKNTAAPLPTATFKSIMANRSSIVGEMIEYRYMLHYLPSPHKLKEMKLRIGASIVELVKALNDTEDIEKLYEKKKSMMN